MTGSHTPRHRLWDILDAIRLIRIAVSGLDLSAYKANPEKRAAVERWILTISEASRHLPADLKATQPGIPWDDIAEAGNFLRHVYDQVWPERTWSLIEDDLEPLRIAVVTMYEMVREPKDPNPPS
ncbi:MAG: HepT-like ribonuclease domain-containing protein [Hyphomonadaceae bacterium]|nr:HepT-like ribonuclease domain-containing protein [Hyphomonadaceae bacterium]